MIRPIISFVEAGKGALARAEDTFVYILTGLPRKPWLSAWFETRLSREDQGQKIDWCIFSQAILAWFDISLTREDRPRRRSTKDGRR